MMSMVALVLFIFCSLFRKIYGIMFCGALLGKTNNMRSNVRKNLPQLQHQAQMFEASLA